MPASVTVWAVELDRASSLEEVRGTLSLEEGELVFQPRAEGSDALRIPVQDIVKAKRLRASPVLMVLHGRGGGQRRTAFYFVQPPPMEPPSSPASLRPNPFFMGRTGRRKVRRQNMSYLGLWNREKKHVVREWERQVNDAMAGATREG